MGEWSPEVLFAVTYAVSALSGLGFLLLSNKVVSVRTVCGTIIVYGGLGSGFGMIGVYSYLGGKAEPWKVIGFGMLIGVGAIKKSFVTTMLIRMLSPESKGKGDDKS